MSDRYEISFTEGGVGLAETIVTLGMAPIIEKTLDAVTGDQNHGWNCTIKDKITGIEQTVWGVTKAEAQEKTFAAIKVAIENYQTDQLRQRQEEERRRREEEEYLSAKRERETYSSSSSSSSSSENPFLTFVAYVTVVILAIAAVLWLAANIVLPLLVLNSALILTVLALIYQQQKTLLSVIAFFGGAFMLLDIANSGLSGNFIDNVVKNPAWISAFVYINAAALGLSTWFLAKPLWEKGKLIEPSNKRNGILIMAAVGLLVGVGMAAAPVLYHSVPNRFAHGGNYLNSQKFTQSRTTQESSNKKNDTPNIAITPSDGSDAITQPIRNLFSAWEQLDLNVYMDQWDKNAMQYSKKFSPRNYQDILKRRQTLFDKLAGTTVTNYQITSISKESTHRATVYVKYSMVFNFKTGKSVTESDVTEKYVLTYDDQSQRWRILNNYDYTQVKVN